MMKALKDKCITITGQPNTGKSTIFSVLTGLDQEVGNWPGKTVEKKAGRAPENREGYEVVDLPGSYSFHAHSPEQGIAVDFLRHTSPDLVIITASAISPERTLAFAVDVMMLGHPSFIVLNMADIAGKMDDSVFAEKLSGELGVPVLLATAVKKDSIETFRKKTAELLLASNKTFFNPERAFSLLPGDLQQDCLECVQILAEKKKLSPEKCIGLVWLALREDKQSREFLREALGEALPLEKVLSPQAAAVTSRNLYAWLATLTYSGKVSCEGITRTAVWDKWLLHPLWGSLVMFLFFLFTLVVGFGLGFPLAFGVVKGFSALTPFLMSILENYPVIQALAFGVWKGLSAVCCMLPFLTVFYTVFSFLEDIGYMARTAFLTDRIMGRIGLNGKTFIPLLFSVPCNISGVTGCRTIDDPRQRLLTLLVIPLVPCAAQIVTIVVFSVWLFEPLTAFFLVLGLLCINMLILAMVTLVLGKIVHRNSGVKGMLMELPHYHWPNLRAIGRDVFRNVKGFVEKAFTLIICFSTLLWFIAYYPGGAIETSLLGSFGKFVAPLGEFMGLDWRLLTALLASGVSKEALLATLGVLYEVAPGDLPATLASAVPKASAIAFMSAQSLFLPCLATVGVLYSESRSWKVMLAIWGYTLILPVLASALVFRISLCFW